MNVYVYMYIHVCLNMYICTNTIYSAQMRFIIFADRNHFDCNFYSSFCVPFVRKENKIRLGGGEEDSVDKIAYFAGKQEGELSFRTSQSYSTLALQLT